MLADDLLPFAGCFEFLFNRLPMVGRQIGGFDFPFQIINRVAADTALQCFGKLGINDLGKAAEFLLYGLGFRTRHDKMRSSGRCR